MNLGPKIFLVSILSLVLFACLIWVTIIDNERAAQTQKEKEAAVEYISEAPPSAGKTARIAPVDGRRLFLENCSGCHEVNPYAAPSGMNVAGVGSRMSKQVLKTLMLDPPPPMGKWAGSDEELEALIDYMASLTTGRSYLPTDIIPVQPELGLPGHLGGKVGYDIYITRCSICHQINVEEPSGGLNLAGVGSRLDENTIRLLIANPHAGMPDWTGTREELSSLVVFLTGLTESAGTMPGSSAPSTPGATSNGISVYQEYSCNLCHSLSASEPMTLVGVGQRFTDDALKEKISEMPGWTGNDNELDTLASYLAGLEAGEVETPALEKKPTEDEEPEEEPVEEPPAGSRRPDGKAYYDANCGFCHETEGKGGGLNLAGVGSRLGASGIKDKIVNPPGGMTDWEGTDAELDAVLFYLMGLESGTAEEKPAAPEIIEEPPPAKPAGGDAGKGKEYYDSNCGFCHETTGTGGGVNLADLSSRLSESEIKSKIVTPPDGMSPWGGTDEELANLIAYLRSL